MSAPAYKDPATQRDFERWLAKVNRPLSVAEQAGWRRFWDGWVICAPCQATYGDGYTPETWRVPANYDTPIQPTDRCMRCRKTPAEVPVPHALLVAVVLEIFSHG